MDIPRKPRPWYVKYLYPMLAGIAFLAFATYMIVLSFSPRRLRLDSETCRVADVANVPFREFVDVEGIVQPIQTVQVNALESGFVERIVAEEGTMLQAGDTILILSNPELLRSTFDEQEEWQNSERNYREQEIEMQQKSITLRQLALDAEHQMAALDKSLRQSREEFRMGIKSKAELDVAEEEYRYQMKRTGLQMESLRHDSAATRLKREMLRANREASARKLSRSSGRTAHLVVRATVAGQLSYLGVVLGQQVAAGESVGSIKVLTEYKVRASLSEYYIDRITTGLPAHIQQEAQKYPLRISKVVPEVKDRNFPCDLIFTAEKPTNIRLGKSYRVQIELGKPEKCLVIPRGNFYQHTAGQWIYRLSPDGTTARKTPVKIGRQNPQQYEVLSGLQPGDKVLVSGYENLGDAEVLLLE
ncbi:MAG: HlyD family efflux transporter periplasmic adaptor subunit [Alloprevotella sp.]|nr:HlyD family efflux transporter periplasmic adaptor subunit [Alloprevotella sp.]